MTVAVVCGSRKLHIEESSKWWPLFNELHQRHPFDTVWHGDGDGADQGFALWSRSKGIHVEAFPAPWDLFKKAGLNVKAAGRRRIADMFAGRRRYILAHSEHDPEAEDGLVAAQQIEGVPALCIVLPGHVGTRRTVQHALVLGIPVERCYLEPMVVNRWHYQRVDPATGRKHFEFPQPYMVIQRGSSSLANPWKKGIDVMGRYRRWLGDQLRAKDPDILRSLDSITRNHSLVCSCVLADGAINAETGKGVCHGHAVVEAWHWWQRHRDALKKYLTRGNRP